jgi:hypothetical protein
MCGAGLGAHLPSKCMDAHRGGAGGAAPRAARLQRAPAAGAYVVALLPLLPVQRASLHCQHTPGHGAGPHAFGGISLLEHMLLAGAIQM